MKLYRVISKPTGSKMTYRERKYLTRKRWKRLLNRPIEFVRYSYFWFEGGKISPLIQDEYGQFPHLPKESSMMEKIGPHVEELVQVQKKIQEVIFRKPKPFD